MKKLLLVLIAVASLAVAQDTVDLDVGYYVHDNFSVPLPQWINGNQFPLSVVWVFVRSTDPEVQVFDITVKYVNQNGREISSRQLVPKFPQQHPWTTAWFSFEYGSVARIKSVTATTLKPAVTKSADRPQ